MPWLDFLIPRDSVGNGLVTLALAIILGLALGSIRFKGIRLGVSGVLFTGLLFGQFGYSLEPSALQFLRDFALIIFMYSVGLQVGPGFVASMKAEGFRLNVLSLAVIALGALMTVGFVKIANIPGVCASGLYSGAFTTTPGLAAGQEAVRQKISDPARRDAALAATGLAYAVTYPFGLIGPMLSIVALKRLFRIRMADEVRAIKAQDEIRRPTLERMDFRVTQPSAVGVALKHLPFLKETGVVLTRMSRDGVVSVPRGDTQMRLGDIVRATGPRPALHGVVDSFGIPATGHIDLDAGDIQRMDIPVTRTAVLRRSLRELNFSGRAGVTIARIDRAGIQLMPTANLTLHFGDQVAAIGPEEGLKTVARELGNSIDRLNRPQLLPIFVGIVLGVMVGSIPLGFPGLSLKVRIGLAGGPMIAAIALAQLGNIGSIVWYMPAAASQLFRDFGLAVFLCCVGLQSGGGFAQRVMHGGMMFVLWGAIITVVPVILVGCVARLIFRMNFVTLSGWVAGAMTSSPALLFAADITQSDSPAVAYAAVAPLAILAPVICAQLLVVGLM